ncbi:hypothetical protein LS66_005560 [Helicobacter sp. MIT 03-1614]|uniref:hypothetical protein n=1 Tax=Helicobacter sp. MIT 03-1614 TaxID=1548147 RepID=UPI00068C0DF7|nr:hypothetical protein [Helicobacter sp. MIT 03-1614]TLD88989.1 hypothetical protein LS66_005560 [Helicobacter sp. MIT 03-1614]
MKIAISCFSPLMQNSLSFFLKDYLSSESECDFIITDDVNEKKYTKAVCFVSDDVHSHIRKPFTQQSLFEDIQAFYENIQSQAVDMPSQSAHLQEVQSLPEVFEPPMSPPSYPQRKIQGQLEAQIEQICQESARDLTQKIIALLKHT